MWSFVRVRSTQEVVFRIYERGCGRTMSSGTGTCAVAAAAMVMRGALRDLTVIAEGGSQSTVWPVNDKAMRLTGPGGDCMRG